MNTETAVQTAVYQALVAAPLTDAPAITDHPPTDDDGDYPSIQIGETMVLSDDVSCADGAETYQTLHVWSRYRGQRQTKRIIGEIHDALHGASLSVAGLQSCHVLIEQWRVMDDPDGLTRHGVVVLTIHQRT